MPMRFRLIALVIVALAISLAIGAGLTLVNASRSVQNEMHSALLVGQQNIDNALRAISTSPDPQRELDDLVDSFKGNRHLRVSVTGDATDATEVRPVVDRPPIGKLPKWFIRLVGVAPETHRAPIVIGGHPVGEVMIQTDPRNEILEVWDEVGGSLFVLAMFAGATLPLIYLFVGRALRPLDRLTAAMEQVGQGDYAIRVDDRLSPELARLRDSFNRMAERLAAADSDNQRLHEQLLTLQEEERSDIARDLHDEIGPFLFAINVDLANATRVLGEDQAAGGKAPELLPHIESAAEAARRLQRHVREMLGRLRAIALAEFGLGEAVAELAEFWRRRYPEIEYQTTITAECEDLGEPFDTVAYRVVQEALSNAVRHGQPHLIAITISRDAATGETLVAVADDGAGLRANAGTGYGLIGMEERVAAIGGRLTFANRPGGGCAVHAVLPPVPPSAPVGPPVSHTAPEPAQDRP